MIKVTEKIAQALLLDYTMQSAAHRIAVPNITDNGHPRVADWEMDLLSVNRSGFTNEYEIKLSRSDYLKDRLKKEKHESLINAYQISRMKKGWIASGNIPNYFWYVTHDFEISDPPDYAGWITIEEKERRDGFCYLALSIKKKAPRLHAGKVDGDKLIMLGRLVSYRLSHAYRSLYKYTLAKETPPA